MAKVGVIGSGAWGTALAQSLAASGQDTLIWARENEVVEEINSHHRNTLFLPDIPLDSSLVATSKLADLSPCSVLLVVVPTQFVRSVLTELGSAERDLILCAKGIEASSEQLVVDIARDASPMAHLAVLSGPTFAHEVARGRPSAVTLACSSEDQWDRLSSLLSATAIRPYYSDDIVGAEIGGAVKNVLAIACGVVDGARLGENARAALISRGFAEMLRFGEAMGARSETLAGLSGLGDLVLTCSSTSSRNFSLGRGLGEGKSPQELLSDRNSVAEGAATAPVLARMASRMNVDMPVARAVCELLSGDRTVDEVIAQLLSRPLRTETA